MHLRPELLRAEENEAEVTTALRDIEQHLSDVSIGSITRRILVELVDENDEVLDAEIPALQVLAKLGHDPSEDEVLRIFLEVGDVHYIHRAIGKAPERKVAHTSGIGDEPRAARRDVRQPVADFPDRRHVMGAPALAVFFLHALEDIAEPALEIGEGLHPVLFAQHRVGEFLVDHVLGDEVDQRVGFGVYVILVEQDLGELQDLAQSPGERRDLVEQRLIVAERVEGETLRRIGREILDMLERFGLDPQLFVQCLVRFLDLARLVQIAEVRAFHIEGYRRNRSLLLREMGK